MTHLIYIYFIVNAFLAGISSVNNYNLLKTLVILLFGLPIGALWFIYACIYDSISWIVTKLIIIGWFRLLFTNYYGNLPKITVKIRKQQYQGIRSDNTNFNRYERFFMRQIDKKYNYGITKKDD